jgi:ribosomal protein L37E
MGWGELKRREAPGKLKEHPMNRFSTTRRSAFGSAHIECQQCGAQLYLPEWSEWQEDGGRVRHLWACDSCGYAFETSARYAIEIDTAA